MSEAAPERRIWVVRHGETEWSRSGQHTGRTDVPLTATGRAQAVALGEVLRGHRFALVLTSPRSRAMDTAHLAGLDGIVIEPDLAEWDYGALEGRTTPDIRAAYPGWTIWSGPWPDGETPAEVAARADRVIERCLDPSVEGDVLLVSHGHMLRVVAARWLRQPPVAGGMFGLSTATVGVLGWEHGMPVIERWNEACHLAD